MRLVPTHCIQIGIRISIHAPREGCDTQCQKHSFPRWHYFNPRTPRGVRHPESRFRDRRGRISIHAPREGCDKGDTYYTLENGISIHAPREGCDVAQRLGIRIPKYFNPRTPRGVRPEIFNAILVSISISIHAPREGCDLYMPVPMICLLDFNPRTPRGVRH